MDLPAADNQDRRLPGPGPAGRSSGRARGGGRPVARRPGRLSPRRGRVTWGMFDYGGVVSHPPTQQDMALLAGAADAEVPALMDVDWGWRRGYDRAELDAPGDWEQVG